MRVDRERLDRTLNPKTVVVVGDAKARNNRWLRSNKTVEGNGNLYSVQVDPNELAEIEALGVENFSSLADVPGEIDYVLVAVPRQVAPLIMRHCIARDVAGAAFFTSGFAETDTDEGRELQETLKTAATESGLVVIGPNCMGLYNPAAGVRFGPEPAFRVRRARSASSRRAAPTPWTSSWPRTTPACASARPSASATASPSRTPTTSSTSPATPAPSTSRCTSRACRTAAASSTSCAPPPRIKPVVLWKGGRSSDGSRATRSHTASLAGSTEVWNALCRQTGAIQADSLTEAVDILKTLSFVPPFTGTGIGVMGGSGGQSVSMTDAFGDHGMRVPELGEASLTQLGEWFSLVGASFRNPIDMGTNRTELEQILGILDDDDNVDVISMQLRPRPKDDPEREQLDEPVAALATANARSLEAAHRAAALTDAAAARRGDAGARPGAPGARHRRIPELRPRSPRAREGQRLLPLARGGRRRGVTRLPRYEHEQLVEHLRRLNTPPESPDEFQEWLSADQHLQLLRENAASDELIVHASGRHTLVHAVAVAQDKLIPTRQEDLLRWSGDLFSGRAGYVVSGSDLSVDQGGDGWGTETLRGATA